MNWWYCAALAGLLALLLAGHRSRFAIRLGLVVVSLTLVGIGAWSSWRAQKLEAARKSAAFHAVLPTEGRPGGYVSSSACKSCHAREYETWHRSYHRTMTQFASPESVKANFDHTKLEFMGETFELDRRGDEFWVTIDDQDPANSTAAKTPPVRQRIGMLTGSHHMQVFWLPGGFGNMQIVFPFTYLFESQRWVPRADTFLRDPALPPSMDVWNMVCIRCHATGGQPRPDRESRILTTRSAELGIACEACHGPGERHVKANQNARPGDLDLPGRPADATIIQPARLTSRRASEICGQCHSIKWFADNEEWRQNGFAYRPGDELEKTTPIVRPKKLETQPWLHDLVSKTPHMFDESFWSDGMVRVSGREYNGMIESPCYLRGELSCLSCHSMHKSEPANQLAKGAAENTACLRCHSAMNDRVPQHTHHQADSSGSLCYNCHMPYTTYGLLKGIRSHQIDSPNVATTVQTGRPNACNLCHLDRTLDWTSQQLSRWYQQPATPVGAEERSVSAALLWLLRGDAGQRALIANSMGWEAAKQASGERWLAPFLASLLDDPYSAVRYIAGRSLTRLPGFAQWTYDFVAPATRRAEAGQAALAIWSRGPGPDRRGTNVLIGLDGRLEQERITAIQRRRDDRPVHLRE